MIFFNKTKLNDDQWNPPKREIWSRSAGSHPEEKSGLDLPDPTPKRNLVYVHWIPPRRNFWVGDRAKEETTKVDLDLGLWSTF